MWLQHIKSAIVCWEILLKLLLAVKVWEILQYFLITKGVKPEDLINLPQETGFPQSVIDLLSGNLGQPKGGWPKAVQKVILGKQKPMRSRPGASAPKMDLKKAKSSLIKQLW